MKPKINAVIDSLIKKTLRKSSLSDYLEKECNIIQKNILSTQIKLWQEDNPAKQNDSDPDYFDLSCGKLFEYYFASIINTNDWRILSWRGDKIPKLYNKSNTTNPESNSHPDFILEYHGYSNSHCGFKPNDRVAIECKWKNNHNNTLTTEECTRNKLKKIRTVTISRKNKNKLTYSESALIDGACSFYFAIGVGWLNKKPEAVYLIPANRIDNIENIELNYFKLKRKPIFRKKDSLIRNILSNDEISNILFEEANRLIQLGNNVLAREDRKKLEVCLINNISGTKKPSAK